MQTTISVCRCVWCHGCAVTGCSEDARCRCCVGHTRDDARRVRSKGGIFSFDCLARDVTASASLQRGR
ncbi:hypothetical protein MRX96_035719 [Rhipicephalus microplus]